MSRVRTIWRNHIAASGGGGSTPHISAITLPSEEWNPDYSLPTGGTTYYVSSDGYRNDDETAADYTTLQAALNAVSRGDVIKIKNGDVQEINADLTVPSLGAGTDWVYVEPEDMGEVPAAGTRIVSGADGDTPNVTVANLPEIRLNWNGSNNYYQVVFADSGTCSYWRFTGLIINNDPDDSSHQGTGSIVYIGDTGTLANQPNHIVFDRCIADNLTRTQVRRSFYITGPYVSIVNSQVRARTVNSMGDGQTILAINAPGPVYIGNNSLRDCTETIMTGGGDADSAANMPSDWTIRGNHFRWTQDAYTNRGTLWQKNVIEIKLGVRFLIENNVFENYWDADDNQLYPILFKAVNQYATEVYQPLCRDITFRYNRLHNMKSVFYFVSADAEGGGTPPQTSKVAVYHNLCTDMGTLSTFGDAYHQIAFIETGGAEASMSDIYFVHNTLISDGGGYTIFGDGENSERTGVAFLNNLLGDNAYGGLGYDGGSENVLDNMVAAQNAVVNCGSSLINDYNTWGTSQPTANSALVNNLAGDDYSAAAAYQDIADTGTVDLGFADMGCDIDTLGSRVAGVRQGGDLSY